jgi:holo-[acyl-carrier protein] synthase
MKALGVGLGAFDFHDVSVEKLPSGAPGLQVTGRARQLADSQGVGGWHVSITHTDTVAMAVVAAL